MDKSLSGEQRSTFSKQLSAGWQIIRRIVLSAFLQLGSVVLF